MSELVTVDGLVCSRGGRILFQDFSLQAAAGESVVITGQNGSGKTTLLKILAGLYSGYEGQVHSARSLYLGHKPGISPLLTPVQGLAWYARLLGSDPGSVDRALERVGLAALADTPCAELSAGQVRRAALARFALTTVSVWLMDEPVTALDTEGQAWVVNLIDAHTASGGTAIVSTHQTMPLVRSRGVAIG